MLWWAISCALGRCPRSIGTHLQCLGLVVVFTRPTGWAGIERAVGACQAAARTLVRAFVVVLEVQGRPLLTMRSFGRLRTMTGHPVPAAGVVAGAKENPTSQKSRCEAPKLVGQMLATRRSQPALLTSNDSADPREACGVLRDLNRQVISRSERDRTSGVGTTADAAVSG
jgi:hypothetical protein